MSHARWMSTHSGNMLLTVLWFGTLWGAIEAVLGGVLHVALPPTYPGRVMIAVAVMLMAYAVDRSGCLWMPAAMALVAAPLKLLSAPFLALPIAAPAVLNPAFAIVAEGVAFTLAAYVLFRLPLGRTSRLVLVGAVAGVLQIGVFVVLVRALGLALYPPAEVLQALGTKFPDWASTLEGTWEYVLGSLPSVVAASAFGGAVAGIAPRPTQQTYTSRFLLRGTAACVLAIVAVTVVLG